MTAASVGVMAAHAELLMDPRPMEFLPVLSGTSAKTLVDSLYQFGCLGTKESVRFSLSQYYTGLCGKCGSPGDSHYLPLSPSQGASPGFALVPGWAAVYFHSSLFSVCLPTHLKDADTMSQMVHLKSQYLLTTSFP